MLDLMRRQSYLIYLVFGGIIFIFAVNFGPGSNGCTRAAGQQAGWAAKVDGEAIPQRDFFMLYQRQMDYMQRLAARTGQPFDASMAERLGLRKQVADQLVERRLLAREAHARGVYISDNELATFLRDRYGIKDVDYSTYEQIVQQHFGTSNVARFEEDTRNDIAAQRMAQMVGDTVDVGDDELKQDFERSHDRAKVMFVRFDVDPHQASKPTEAEIAKALKDEMPAVEQQYTKDAMAYRTPQQAHVRQIVRKLSASATDAEVAEARNTLNALREQVEKGGDFGSLAQQQSQDEKSAKAGGDLGWIGRGQLARPLEEAAFALQPNQTTSEPVRSPIGLHLLQVVERKDPVRRELAEVKHEVAASLLRDRAAEALAKSQAGGLLAALHAGKSWDDVTVDEDAGHTSALKAAKLTRRETPWILRSQESIPRIGISKDLRSEIFTLTKAAPMVQRPYKVAGSYYVVGLKERELPDASKFTADREALREQALSTKRNRVLHDWLAYLRNQSKVQLNPAVLSAPEAG